MQTERVLDKTADISSIHCSEYEITGEFEQVTVAEAPGRIHYLGEHGEPGAGLYLSSAVNRTIQVAVSLRRDNSIRFFASNLGERKRTTLVNLKYKREDRWANYIKLAIHVFAGLGFFVKGLNFTVGGDIPQQVGLASSTAIEVAAAVALRSFFKAPLTDKELLLKLAKGESDFLGRDGSLVDYLIAFQAKKNHFLLVDEKSLETLTIKSPFTRYTMLLMDSRVPRMGVDEELQQRRIDINRGLEFLIKRKTGESFRDFAPADLLESMGDINEEIRRRSLHVVEENLRVKEAQDALKRGELAEFSRIIYHSHESLRDLYEVSCPEIDWLVKRSQEIEGVLASRMTGPGFGGCTYTILKGSALEEYRKRLEDYERIFGFHPLVYDFCPAAGARLVTKG
ncbi:MAG: galactokinase [Spirochaetaceae bacterium]|jgi:galactokinase|nr:galactokinase [Spirochaetaceae bacterium]